MLLWSVVLVWCLAKKPTDGTQVDQQETIAQWETEVQEPSVQQPKVAPKKSNKEEDNLAGLYANVLCMMMDPTFREWFRESENGWEDPEDAEESMTELYRSYGYDSEEEVEEALKKYAPQESFLQKISEQVEAACPESVNEAAMNAVMEWLRSGELDN